MKSPIAGTGRRRSLAVPVLTMVAVTTFATAAGAVTIGTGDVYLHGGGPGGSEWDIDDYTWCDGDYGMVINEGTLDPIDTTDVGYLGDAFDGAYFTMINGVEFSPPVVDGYPVFSLDAPENASALTAGPSLQNGLLATQQFKAYPDSAVMRVMLTLTNPTSSAISRTVRVAGDVGSDGSTTIRSTSSGDTSVTATDRWAVTSDTSGYDPVLTHVMAGPDAPLAPSSFVFGGSACPGGYAYSDEFFAEYAVSLGGGQTGTLVWFVEMSQTIPTAIETASLFDSTSSVAATFLSDLTAGQLGSVLNWAFAQPAPASPNYDGDIAPDADDNCPFHMNNDQADSDGDGVGDACAGITAAYVDGNEVFSDGDGESTREDSLQTSVTAPLAGVTSIEELPGVARQDGGVVHLPHEVVVHTADDHASIYNPVVLEFRVDGSVLPSGLDPDDLGVIRDGEPVADCVGDEGVATPDPCTAGAELDGDDVVVTVLTSKASTWGFTVPAPCATGGPSGFGDVTGNVHETAIACVADWGVTTGVSQGRYAPKVEVTRGQMATFLHRVVQLLGGDLPAGEDAFSDDDGTQHEPAINALAAAGIVTGASEASYDPSAPISRATMASFMVASVDYLTGALPAGADAFSDDDGHAHEAAIDAAAEAGLVDGHVDGTYRPDNAVKRDQMASFLTRLIEIVISRG